jgi:hypothetical protein
MSWLCCCCVFSLQDSLLVACVSTATIHVYWTVTQQHATFE